ncbi:MAG: hypothetical protein HZB42_11955 [Sphingobacteriales bacterium]|nr:hypothetical protein [Sphingobacteriales bacterium]
MKLKFLLAATAVAASLFILSCGGGDKKKDDSKGSAETTVGPSKESGDGMVPNIDTAALKDEASILDAMQKYVDAQIAIDKKKKEDPSAESHFLEMTKLHSAILRASTAYSQTLTDPAKAVEFSTKVSDIEKKMYGQ